MKPTDGNQPRDLGDKTLLIAASHTGNNIFCTPAISFLKKHYPNTIFDVVALNKKSAEVFYGNSDINNIFITDSTRQITKLSQPYSAVICMNYKSKDVVSGIKEKLVSVPPLVLGVHHADQLLEFISKYTGYDLTESDRNYKIGHGLTAELPHLEKSNIKYGDILICMHLGCGKTAIHGWKFFYKNKATHQRLWLIDSYIELATQMIQANPNIRFVITGTKHEGFLGRKFEKSIPGTINLIGKTSVPELFKLMNKLDLFISQDCGIFHVASASEIPLIGLFGPTNPENTGPYPFKNHHIVIKRDSMIDITPSEVAVTALEVLKKISKNE
jgi:ADP-heptose:LPS heptosyltransferase